MDRIHHRRDESVSCAIAFSSNTNKDNPHTIVPAHACLEIEKEKRKTNGTICVITPSQFRLHASTENEQTLFHKSKPPPETN